MSGQKPAGVSPGHLGAGLAIGIGVGTAFGVALDNLGLGLAIGIALGLVFGIVFSAGGEEDQSEGDPPGRGPIAPSEPEETSSEPDEGLPDSDERA